MHYCFLCLLIFNFVFSSAFASNKIKNHTILKADSITGNKNNKKLTAIGNVEVINTPYLLKANSAEYENKTISAFGKVIINNLEVGKVFAKQAKVTDDFKTGVFDSANILFNDGSYIFSSQINRNLNDITTLKDAVFSICPNEEIAKDNSLAGKLSNLIIIKSNNASINRHKNSFTAEQASFYFYKIPFLHMPYLKAPLPPRKRQSGILAPSYSNNSNFGFGVKLPYYIDISPSADLTILPTYYFDSQQILLDNQLRQITNYGKYQANLELANNNTPSFNDKMVIDRTGKNIRWNIIANGDFDFTHNTGIDFDMRYVSDRNFLRDYHFNYLSHTTSSLNANYITKDNYLGIKIIKFQELENANLEKSAPYILPKIEFFTKYKPLFSKDQISLAVDTTSINREKGLQYQRLSTAPQIKLPFNISGNLFEFNTKIIQDFYWLNNTNNQEIYSANQTNLKTENSFSWSLPLRKELQKNTITLEPIIKITANYFKTRNNKIVNQDSNNSEITIGNLFTNNRIAGFDRNEAGKRISYGLKASSFGQRELDFIFGQSFVLSNKEQDIKIRGFNNSNKSNFVGQIGMTKNKYFNFTYNFQLQESNLRNDVNQLNTYFNYKKVFLNNEFLLIRKTVTNPNKISQFNSNLGFQQKKWQFQINLIKDLIQERIIQRGVSIVNNGCCVDFGFSVSENNQSNLVKPQHTFTITFAFKNL
jgi:LPS-assembly protein